MRTLMGILLLIVASRAMALDGQIIENYRQNQNNQNDQTSTTEPTNDTVIYAPTEQSATAPHGRAAAGYAAGAHNNNAPHQYHSNQHERGNVSRER